MKQLCKSAPLRRRASERGRNGKARRKVEGGREGRIEAKGKKAKGIDGEWDGKTGS